MSRHARRYNPLAELVGHEYRPAHKSIPLQFVPPKDGPIQVTVYGGGSGGGSGYYGGPGGSGNLIVGEGIPRRGGTMIAGGPPPGPVVLPSLAGQTRTQRDTAWAKLAAVEAERDAALAKVAAVEEICDELTDDVKSWPLAKRIINAIDGANS